MEGSPNSHHNNGQEMAIIGMAGRFPGASNIDEFWRKIRDGVECISFFSDADLMDSGVDAATLADPHYVKAGGVLEGIEFFDASFFGYSPGEAKIMDPQHRLFLECAWEALEHAGYDSARYDGLIGAYAGTGMSSYLLNLFSHPELIAAVGGFQLGVGNNKDHLTTRVSYKLGLEGPAVTVQTTCSTSLVAVHLACQSLLGGECDMALAGGVTIEVPQKAGYFYQEGGILSPDGHCRAFDASARGTVGGNGVGVVVLKRLEDAVSDGDTIYALIKGSAINNDGSLKMGYTAPRVEGQAEVIKAAQEVAGVEPETITYIEAHGTGTELGDPIEVAALNRAFRSRTDKKGFCAIGSVKTNIGHLDTASGVAGLIKTALALKHKQIPPSLHFKEANPKIEFEGSPFYVNRELKSWERNGEARRAGVSSFGIGGTNAHVILEEWEEEEEERVEGREWQLLVMSGDGEAALEAVTERLGEHLREHREERLADVAYTLQVGRRALSHRRILVCENHEDAITALEKRGPKRVFSSFDPPCERPVVFMFPGQGAQHVNMGLDLYVGEPLFRAQVDMCSEMLRPYLGLDLRDVLYPSYRGREVGPQSAAQLKETRLAQPALFVVSYALAKMWIERGVAPSALVGHSIGEYVAACLAGVIALPEALKLVEARGRLMQLQPRGAMLSVALSEPELSGLLNERLSLAAVNGPALCVISGADEEVDELERELKRLEVSCSRLHTSHAFHSSLMDGALEPFSREIEHLQLKPPTIPCISNVTGAWLSDEQAMDPSYWVQQLRRPVRFSQGLEHLLRMQDSILLEVGPGQTLSALAKRHPEMTARRLVLSSLRRPDEQEHDLASVLKALGRLWLSGAEINWSGFYANERRRRLALPTYPFERQRHWVDLQPLQGRLDENPGSDQHAVRKVADKEDWLYLPSWKRSVIPAGAENLDPDDRRRWLLFRDDFGLGSELARKLEQEGREVITVSTGARFSRLGADDYEICPRNKEDYEALIRGLITDDKLPSVIVHQWGVTTPEDLESANETADEALIQSQYRGFYSLLYLAQALAEQAPAETITIQVVTNNIHEVIGQEAVCAEKSTVLGLCKVIPQEYPNIICRSIDIMPAGQIGAPDSALVRHLAAEVTVASSDLVVAYRGNHRWVQSFEPLALKEGGGSVPRLRVNGVYLITGGLGLIGLALCEYLAQTLQARLVLTSRSAFPPEREWEQWLATHDAEDEVSRKIRRLKSVEGMGGEVMVMRADVSKEEEMRSVIEEAGRRYGGINGVIHAAGIVGDASIRSVSETDESDYERQLSPKIHGLYVLEKLLSEQDLDFCFLLSSLSCILGGLGFTAYTAVNLFMDAFAHKRNRASKFPWISVDWDGWRFNQVAGDGAEGRGTWAQMGLTPGEGMQVFERVLAMERVGQVIISTGDLQSRIEQWVTLESVREKKTEEKK